MKRIDSTVEPGETVIQVVIAVPIVLSMLLIAVQAMLFMHSAQIASLAASKGGSQISDGNRCRTRGTTSWYTNSSDRKRLCSSPRSRSGAERCTIFS
jgi:hypothetical protein